MHRDLEWILVAVVKVNPSVRVYPLYTRDQTRDEQASSHRTQPRTHDVRSRAA